MRPRCSNCGKTSPNSKQAMAHQLIALDNLQAAQRELKNQLTSTTLDA
jgi:hypothetical protein